MNRWWWPGLFAALVVLLAAGLARDPTRVSSPLVDRPLPAVRAELLADPARRFDAAALRGQWSLLNVWASWCVACIEEHALLLEAAGRLPVYGINHRDARADALRWLRRHGNPYRATMHDPDGRVGIEFGIYKVPETFLIDPGGIVRYRHAGVLTEEVLRREFFARAAQARP